MVCRPHFAGEPFQLGWSNRRKVASVNGKQKGRRMIAQLLKRKILPGMPEQRYPRILQHVVLLIAVLIFVSGFRLMADLELTRAQLAVGYAIVFSLVLQCCILVVLLEL